MTHGTHHLDGLALDGIAADPQIRTSAGSATPAPDVTAPGEVQPGDPAKAGPRVASAGGFAGVARLELDELLGHLIDRATEVQRTQGRLRGLLRAYLQVARADGLEELLTHLLDAARTLVGARYAALGVIEDGRLVRFLHVGMDAETVRAVGVHPEGKGLLGRLIDYPEPLRLQDITEHVSSIGFPVNHPPMRSFLGVPIRIGSRVYGNLYLADKPGAEEFSADDEELTTALAVAAGIAIDNAALLHESRRRQQWQTTMMALSTAVLGSDDPVGFAYGQIVAHTSSLSSAAGVCVCVPTDDPDTLLVAAGDGVYTARVGTTFPAAGSVYADALAGSGPVVVVDPGADPRTARQAVEGAGPTVGLLMRSEAAVTGVLYVCNKPGGAVFDRLDLELLVGYASHAALVLQLAHAHHDNAQLRSTNDRQRIAEDLHHHVLHRMSRLGMDLHSLAARVHDSAAKAMVMTKIDDTDTIIHELRSAIFSLHPIDTTREVVNPQPTSAA